VSDFTSKGVGLTETLLKFAHEEHLPIAIEYVDGASVDQLIAVSLQSKTVRQTLDSILRNGCGYSWRLRNGIVEITNRHAHLSPYALAVFPVGMCGVSAPQSIMIRISTRRPPWFAPLECPPVWMVPS
jgi:hypothetical protein